MAKDPKSKKDRRPIVCGTDFSANAMEAVDIAAEMARRLDVKLLLLHVEEFRGLAAADPGLFEQVASKNRQDLSRETERVRKSGTKVEGNLLSGSIFNELVDAAFEADARLMVVGAVGHGVARRLLVGSVAERVAETSAIPTLVLRPGSKLRSWLRGKHTLKVLAGYDFSAAGDAGLRWLNEMQGLGTCDISVVHIDWPQEEAHRFGHRGPLPLTENPEEIKNFLERDLSERVALLLSPEKVTVAVEPGWGHPEGHLFEIAYRKKADLVVVGTHRRHGLGRLRFGSVSRTVLHHATAAVAVVPPPEEQRRPSTPRLERVIAATDFSELGNKAVPYACAVLQRGGTLRLVHVIEPAGKRTGEKSKPRPSKGNPKLLAKLRSLVPADAAERFDIRQEIIESENEALAIVQAAERFHADAICIGSHGENDPVTAFLGPIAQGVLANSKRPVLIVRADEE